MAVSSADYPPDAVEAAKAVLVEMAHVLGEYRDDMVIVGGWVPLLLIPGRTDHVGSTDVDIAINHLAENDEVYARITKSLLANGYRQDPKQPFIWYKDVTLKGSAPVVVEVDFLSGEYGGTGRRHRTQKMQDLRPRKARGADLLFDETVEREVEGQLPSGAIDRVTVKVAGVVPYIVMKSAALATRIKEKDAYDIWYTLANYPGGNDAILVEFLPFADHGLVCEMISVLDSKFASPEHFGPDSVAVFLELSGEDAEVIKRDAFERVQALLRGLAGGGA